MKIEIFEKIKELTSRNTPFYNWQPTNINKDIYLKIARRIVKEALKWQDDKGIIIDPYEKKEVSTLLARFIGAVGFLIDTGENSTLVEKCVKSMNIAVERLYYCYKKPVYGSEFYVKEGVRGYLALKGKVSENLIEKWGKFLGSYDPEKTYTKVLSKCKSEEIHNFITFAISGEQYKKFAGLADNTRFIEKYLEIQKSRFTEYGMYMDPGAPMAYDWTSRMNLSLLFFFGYKGKHFKFYDEVLRKGGLISLLYISPNGEAPYGGRSNQYHFNEITLSLICEYEANRYKKLGELELAGVFKRTARVVALTVLKWLQKDRVFRHIKNSFCPSLKHGFDPYGYYSVYSLLIASLSGFSYLLSNDKIEERPAPFEIGGYVVYLPEPFHKIFATCQGYHIEIDTKSDHGYDATGLGRIHKFSVPSEICISVPIVSNPEYHLAFEPSPRDIALGPGWGDRKENIQFLSQLSDEIEEVEIKTLSESVYNADFKVHYKGKFSKCNEIIESYRITKDGVEIEEILKGSANFLLVQAPLLITDGKVFSEIKKGDNFFEVRYKDHRYLIKCLYPGQVKTYIENFLAPNRNGIYKVGVFRTSSKSAKYKVIIE